MAANEGTTAELSIDTASDYASVALSSYGSPLAETTWRCQANHSVEVLPAIDCLFRSAGMARTDLQAVFVNRGPGSYGGLRAGISLAMSMASALAIPIFGVGRLEIDAYQHSAHAGTICAVHRAGRGDLACAIYRSVAGDLDEIVAPVLLESTRLAALAPPGTLFCGEVDAQLAALLRESGTGANIASPAASIRRAGMLAELAWRRFAAGARAPYGIVEAMYLREPNITQPKQRLQQNP
jgi:tRNA threonylcarbamoyladenosine biosynthesis protein TsaB